MTRGMIVRLVHRGVFKLAVVLGPSRVEGKIRVLVWSDVARSWSNPQTQRIENLFALDEGGCRNARERAVLRRATAAAAGALS